MASRIPLGWKISYYCSQIFGRRHTCDGRDCSNRTRRVIRFIPEGSDEYQYVKQPKDEHYCPDCIKSMCIKCAWCSGLIMVGDPVTLYSPRNKSFVPPEHAAVYNDEPLQLVGCLGWNCADTGADRAGFWVPPGKVDRVASPMEELMSRMNAGEEEPVVITGDLSDPNQAARFVEK